MSDEENETRTLRARIQLHEFLLFFLVFLNLFQLFPAAGDSGTAIMLIVFGMLAGLLYGRLVVTLYGGKAKRVLMRTVNGVTR